MAAYQSESPPDFQDLLGRCELVSLVLYAQYTIDEFCHLLVGTLVVYAVSLQSMLKFADVERHAEEAGDAKAKGPEGPELHDLASIVSLLA
jgi:hypothetical protein